MYLLMRYIYIAYALKTLMGSAATSNRKRLFMSDLPDPCAESVVLYRYVMYIFITRIYS